jgi:hypothetical protein
MPRKNKKDVDVDIKVNNLDKIVKRIENWDHKNKKVKCRNNYAGCGGGYCVGFIGAVVYYISTATGFWNGVLGVLKALVWPAFLVYEVLKFVGA